MAPRGASFHLTQTWTQTCWSQGGSPWSQTESPNAAFMLHFSCLRCFAWCQLIVLASVVQQIYKPANLLAGEENVYLYGRCFYLKYNI